MAGQIPPCLSACLQRCVLARRSLSWCGLPSKVDCDGWWFKLYFGKQDENGCFFFLRPRVHDSASFSATQRQRPDADSTDSFSRTPRVAWASVVVMPRACADEFHDRKYAHAISSLEARPQKNRDLVRFASITSTTVSHSPTPEMRLLWSFAAAKTGDAHLGYHTQALVPSAWRQALAPPPNQRHQQGAERLGGPARCRRCRQRRDCLGHGAAPTAAQTPRSHHRGMW